MSVGQDWGICQLYLNLKGIATTVRNMGIERINVDHRQNPTRQIRNRIMPLMCSKCHNFGHQSKNCSTQVHSANQT